MEEGGPAAWVLTTVMLLLAAMTGWVMSSALWAVLACGLLALAAWRYFVPVYFEIGPQGIFQEVFGRRQRISWRSIGHVERGRDGLVLAPGGVACPALRGLYLPWGRHQADVLALVDYHLQQVRHDERVFDFELQEGTGERHA
jgi:hypothetical protein